jgi:hypothetical protein
MPKIWASSVDRFIDIEEKLKNKESIEDSLEKQTGPILTRELALEKYEMQNCLLLE